MRLKTRLILFAAAISIGFWGIVNATAPDIPQGMVYIPAGEFLMGNDGKDLSVSDGVEPANEMPQRKVFVKAFHIDRYEVTNEEYRAYILDLQAKGIKAFSHYDDEGIPIPDRWAREEYPAGEGNHPVVDVDWYMAGKYCESKGKRLPTEAEWEKAARGADGRVYPWGNDYKPEYSNNRNYWAVTMNKKGAEVFGATLPVGSFAKDVSPYGVHDMAGNAMEWTSDLYRLYPGSEMKGTYGEIYVLRGGAHDTLISEYGRTSSRFSRRPTDSKSSHADWHTDMNIGFRCAKDAE